MTDEPEPPQGPVAARINELLSLLRSESIPADPDRTAQTVHVARWQMKARRVLGGGRHFLTAFAESLATLLGTRRAPRD